MKKNCRKRKTRSTDPKGAATRSKTESKILKGKSSAKSSPAQAAKKYSKALEKDVQSPVSSVEKRVLGNSLTPEDRVALLLQNGHLMKEKFVKPVKPVESKKDLPMDKGIIISKSGRIKKKSIDHLKYFDNILKSELMITDTPKMKAKRPSYEGINNNNSDGISDQNKSESDSTDYLNGTKPHKKDKHKSHKHDKESNNTPEKSLKRKHVKKSKKIDETPEETVRKPSKRKQVTLSNGVVLTLDLFQCDYCKKSFSNKSSLRRHIFMHLDIKPYACHHCCKKFRQRCNLQVHLIRKHAKRANQTYVCEHCDKPFVLKENLALHLSSHVKSENSFRCVFCEKRFSHHLLLAQHEKQHLVCGRFQCSICNMSYDCRSRLSVHVKSHLNIKDFVCQYCGKEFLRPNSIRRHVEICHGGYRIQCPICNKKLKGHLTEHLRTHEKKRPHQCPECGQKFTQSTQLTVHKRSHTGARPYPCRICDRPFSHSNALMLHIRRHTGERPFDCAMCPISFSQLPHMKAHMRKIHGKTEAYKCLKCKEFFKLKVQLESHSKLCTVGDKELSFEEKIQASVMSQAPEVESPMTLTRMRFLLALLLTMIASKDKLKVLGAYCILQKYFYTFHGQMHLMCFFFLSIFVWIFYYIPLPVCVQNNRSSLREKKRIIVWILLIRCETELFAAIHSFYVLDINACPHTKLFTIHFRLVHDNKRMNHKLNVHYIHMCILQGHSQNADIEKALLFP